MRSYVYDHRTNCWHIRRFWLFQSTSKAQIPNQTGASNYADKQQVTNSRTGKVERVFVNLEAVYPNPDNPQEEMSFEELRALCRGWLNRDWASERKQDSSKNSKLDIREQSSLSATIKEPTNSLFCDGIEQNLDLQRNIEESDGTLAVEDGNRVGRSGRPRKIKMKEVKGETQTSKNLRLMATCTN